MGDKTYDIIFIYGFSRLHPYLLNIIKCLGGRYRIGIFVLDVGKFITTAGGKRIGKLHDTEKIFIDFCQNSGAEIVFLNQADNITEKFSANLLIIPQAPFKKDSIEFIKTLIMCNKIIGVQGFGYGEILLDELFEIGCSKFFVYDKKIFTSIIKKEKRDDLLDKFEILEMGAPYMKYSVWDKEEFPVIDYLIAMPTYLFIKNPGIKLNLVKNIYNLLTKLGPEDNVVIKLHNVKDGGNKYIAETNLRTDILAKFAEKFLGKRGLELSSAIFYRKILDKAEPLSKITPYFNFGLELFLPYVKKGVITGISTVIWHCLYDGIPVYNCDSQPFGEHLPNYTGYNNFCTPYCEGRLKSEKSYFDKISASSRNADLIELVKKELS
jgi:hypothetical protein